MSRKRVVEGVDDRGRPKARWEDVPDEAPAFGHMQPAYDTTVERRQLTEAEIADRVGRAAAAEARPPATPTQRAWNGQDPATQLARPALNSLEHLQQSRLNGARRHQEVMAARAGIVLPEEVPIVVKPTTPLEELAIASTRAAEAWGARAAACAGWDIAREALADAWRAVSGEVLEPSGPFQVIERPVATSPAVEPVLIATERQVVPRQAGHHPAKAGEAQEKAERARRVMEAMTRHHGDKRAVAAELGMKVNAVAMVAKHAGNRAEAQA